MHGRYSKFLRPEEVEDFEAFKQAFDLTEDLAFAATKIYHAVDKVEPQQLPSLLEVPSKIALRRKQVLEGVVLKLDVDVAFIREFIARVFTYVTHPADQAELLAYVESYLGAAAPGGDDAAADA